MKKILGVAGPFRSGMVTSSDTEPVTITEGENGMFLKQASSTHAACWDGRSGYSPGPLRHVA